MQTISKLTSPRKFFFVTLAFVFVFFIFLSCSRIVAHAGETYSGLTKINNHLYYYDPVTHNRKSGWITVEGNQYYFHDTQYTALKGIQLINGKYYYFDPETCIRKVGIYTVSSGVTYYFQGNGTLAKGLQTYNGDLYYFRGSLSGQMQYGLNWVNGHLYYFDTKTGKAVKNQSILIGHIIYIFGDNYFMTEYRIENGYENDARTLFVHDSLQYLGRPYDLYGEDNGFSCGGFVSQVCIDRQIDYLPQNASWGHAWRLNQRGQLHSFDYGVDSLELLKPGDFVFWQWDEECCRNWRESEGLPMPCPHAQMDEIHHIAIYLGNGLLIESAEGENGVIIRSIYESNTLQIIYYGSFLGETENQISYPMNYSCEASGNRASLKWDIADYAEGYLIYRRDITVSGSSYQMVQMIHDNMTTHFEDYTVSGKTYNYMLYAYRYINGTLKLSQPGIAGTVRRNTADSIGVAVIPQGVVCNPHISARNYGSITLSWDSVPGADGYLIYGNKESQSYGYIGMTDAQHTTYQHTGASGSELNHYWVFAFYYDGNGGTTAGPASYCVSGKALTMDTVNNIRAQGYSGKVTVYWDSVPNADGYLIYGRTASGSYGYIGMTTQGTNFNHTSASQSEYNFYWVYAFRYLSDGSIDRSTINSTAPQYAYAKAL